MLRFLILFSLATIAISINSATENDQQYMGSDRNINFYLAPPPKYKEFPAEEEKSIYREPETQYNSYVLDEHSDSEFKFNKYGVERAEPGEKKIAVTVVEEGKKIFLVEPKSEPEHTHSDNPLKKYELESEGPKKKKITIKVIKEDKKTFEVDPKVLNDNKQIETLYEKPESEYKKYELKVVEPKDKNVFVNVIPENKKSFAVDPNPNNDDAYYEPVYKKLDYNKYIIKEEEPKDIKKIVKVVKENRIPFVVDPKYKNDNMYFETEYRKPEIEYKNSEREYRNSNKDLKLLVHENKDEEPNEKNVFVKIVKEDADPKYADDNMYYKPQYKKPEIDYNNFEPEYGIKDEHKQKNIFTKVVKEDKKIFAARPKYNNDNVYFEPRKSDSDFDKEKNVFVKVVEGNKKTFDPKYKDDDTYFESEYKTEYKKFEPEYHKFESQRDRYEVTEEKLKEKNRFANVVKKDIKPFAFDSKYKNGDTHFEPEYSKSVTEHKNSERAYERTDDSYNQYKVKEEELRDKKIFFDVVNEDNKQFVLDSKYKDNNGFEPEYRKFENKYEKSELDYKKLEPIHNDYEFTRDEPKKKKIFVIDQKYEDNNNFEPEYRQLENKYDKSELDFKKSDTGYHQYEVREEEPKERKIRFNVDNQDKKIFVADSKYENENNSEKKYRKIENEHEVRREEPKEQEIFFDGEDKETFTADSKYENNNNNSFDPEYRQFENQNENEYKKSELAYNQHEVKEERRKERQVFNIGKNDKKYDDNNNTFEREYTNNENIYKKSEQEYGKSEAEEKKEFVNVVKQDDKSYKTKPQFESDSKYDEPKHDVVVKIWTKNSR